MKRFLLAALAVLPLTVPTSAGAQAQAAAAGGLEVTASFVSAKGWVKPGQTYPFSVTVRNPGAAAVDGASVAIDKVPGTAFTAARGPGRAAVEDGVVRWTPGPVAPGAELVLHVDARALTLGQDPELPWKDLSATALLRAAGAQAASRTHGPKVIPPSETYETARYGDRPFPVVPVEFGDRAHGAGSTAERLDRVINDPGTFGSTFNLYQEMSYGQLFPRGTVPSSGIGTKAWQDPARTRFYRPKLELQTCLGLSTASLAGTPLYPDRIKDGWYVLPGTNGFYGSDANGSALIGAQLGVAALQSIDNGCGPGDKVAYDAAAIADPEIDYNDYDTDKDGVVDFFMVVFAGLGGNGVSQTAFPPYDNVWPNSGTLESSHVDPRTGLAGYTTDDRLTDREGRELFYTDATYTKTSTVKTDFPAYVRVGPYNLNPESAIDKASVISHEYGHSLGLPDYYSTGSRTTYGTWNLMAEDRSQHMSGAARQQLGWLIPRVLGKGTTTVQAVDSTRDTHRIDWRTKAGKPYTLTGPGVHNGEGYVAQLPGRRVIDPAIVPSGSHVLWSGSGNDFGCAPLKGRNIDLSLPALADVPKGTKVTLTMKHAFEIEWDFDYAFVLISPNGKNYRSVASGDGYSTPASQNPNGVGCQARFGNGITGSPGSYDRRTALLDRVLGRYDGALSFKRDSFDISALAGSNGVVRFSMFTDAGNAKRGWFIDDLEVKAGDRVLYSSDLEGDDPQLLNGGCRDDGVQTGPACTKGFIRAAAGSTSTADHAYYLELRDRAGFDADGHGQDDRGSGPTFQPGVSLEYLDEFRGDGNAGVDDPPAASPLDATPTPGSENPDLDDAAFTATAPRNAFSDSGEGHVDNYTDPGAPDGRWRFAYDCLSFQVSDMAGAEVGPVTVPGDLTAKLAMTTGPGCAAHDDGYGDLKNAAPTAVLPRPRGVRTGEATTLDASGSYDDLDPVDRLTFRWDTNGDGRTDARGRTIRRVFTRTGAAKVTLTVIDRGKLRSRVTRRFTVSRGRLLASVAVPRRAAGGALRVRARVGQAARVRAVLVRRGSSRVVAASPSRRVAAGRRVVLALRTAGLPKGRYVVRIVATSVAGKRRAVVSRGVTR